MDSNSRKKPLDLFHIYQVSSARMTLPFHVTGCEFEYLHTQWEGGFQIKTHRHTIQNKWTIQCLISSEPHENKDGGSAMGQSHNQTFPKRVAQGSGLSAPEKRICVNNSMITQNIFSETLQIITILNWSIKNRLRTKFRWNASKISERDFTF